MEAIKTFLGNITDQINAVIQPLWDQLLSFLGQGMYVLYGAIAIVLAILILAGLIACFKKIPKFFFTIVVLLAIVVAVWYFLVYKTV